MASTYKIRKGKVGNGPGGKKYPQFVVTLPVEIAAPLEAAGFRVRYEVRDDCIAIIPVAPSVEPVDTDVRKRVVSLVDRVTNGEEV